MLCNKPVYILQTPQLNEHHRAIFNPQSFSWYEIYFMGNRRSQRSFARSQMDWKWAFSTGKQLIASYRTILKPIQFCLFQVTFCDVVIRELGNINRKTVQCVLMINMFNEKIFIAIWFWLLIIGTLTLINLIYWSVISFVPQFSRDFIGHSLVSAFSNKIKQQTKSFLLINVIPNPFSSLLFC